MNVLTLKELKAIIERYEYKVIEKYGKVKCEKKNKKYWEESSPFFSGGSKRQNYEYAVSWILGDASSQEKEKE